MKRRMRLVREMIDAVRHLGASGAVAGSAALMLSSPA